MEDAFPSTPPFLNIPNVADQDDVGLGGLQNLGGLTSVLPLLPGNLAIDHIPLGEDLAQFDQRGVTRPLDGNDAAPTPRNGFDIGAFEAPDNIAFGATATASSSTNGRGPTLARDKNPTTSWQSATNASGMLQLTFSTRTIGSITLREFETRISSYRIETRSGSTWSTLLTSPTGIGATPKIHTFTPKSVNGARIVVTSGNGLPAIREFEVY